MPRDFPYAYHITFGTYGTRLHGDPRGTVIRSMNKPGDRIIGRDDDWVRSELKLLKHNPVVLVDEHRAFIERTIPEICARGGWQLHTSAAMPDHIHVLLSRQVEGITIRRLLKRWLTEALNVQFTEHIGPWWAEGGSVKWIWSQRYFENVYGYILRQRLTPR